MSYLFRFCEMKCREIFVMIITDISPTERQIIYEHTIGYNMFTHKHVGSERLIFSEEKLNTFKIARNLAQLTVLNPNCK